MARPPPYNLGDQTSFGYTTVTRRWPVILTTVIDVLYSTNHNIALANEGKGDGNVALDEGKAMIERISRLKYRMGRVNDLEPIERDGEPLVDEYNVELARLKEEGAGTWFSAPWLFAEYRLLRTHFASASSPSWRTFDPFGVQKRDAWRGSGRAVREIATTMHILSRELGDASQREERAKDDEGEKLHNDEKLRVLFKQMLQMCLWCDLSLLTHLTAADIRALQAADERREAFILRNDEAQVWAHLVKGNGKGRVDIVLDNGLFTDLVFADFLVTYTPYVGRVVFHPKLIPWFVSDVTPPDFRAIFEELSDPAFFPADDVTDGIEGKPDSNAHLQEMVARWKRHLADGTFALSVPLDTPLGGTRSQSTAGGEATPAYSRADATPEEQAQFWTSPWPYWDMETRAPALWASLRESSLVVFKWLTGDVQWPAYTPFATALGPLAGSFPLLSLRTNKADVVVGVDKDVAERLEREEGQKWRVDGRYALITFEDAAR
ncbi:hypothetical protein PLICRDRAFT_58283 [Plicaturopsis crispa FD-325 SS-3]|uniref:Sugar phosphate phosphatase n=1 Tax=Plicaturopsis crispa FD-325 SS-3 TaxID=944288 RepID=A0A0C9SQJ6_PLICR|nr:hypothetical protein PLICRDRAFT_58283 [Plicaturopsis crispa FD-325 SS-3]